MENAKAIKKLSPKERVREFLDEIEIRFIDAERKCGFSRGYLGTGGEMTTDKLRMLKKNYPTIDIQYIVTGKLRDPKKERITKAKELARQNKLKRDGNSIKDYYDNWDRVNEDDELIDVDTKITMNNNSNEEIIKNLYNEKQKSNADKNVSISIKSNRNRTNLNNNNNKNIIKSTTNIIYISPTENVV